MTEQQAQRSNENDLLWRHLKTVPAFRALLRAVEARFYRHIDIPGPTLDLGCGDGHFAAMAFDHPLAAGADPWWGPLRKAQAAGVYRLNVQAMGHRLPFPNNHFASVISNSVLEHIPDVQPVLAEAGRVLQPDGKLVVTMPSHLFTTYLGGASLLRPLGLDNTYRRFFNTISRHAHTDPPELWCERLAHAGFRITRWQYYFSRGALRALELGHVQGLPSAILHFLTGHWILAPWPDSLRPTERWVRPFYEESPPDEGAYLFIVAQKVADSAIAPFLPPADPLPVDEPLASEQISASTQAQPAPPPTLAPPPVAESTASGTRSPARPSVATAGQSAERAPSPTTTEAQPRGDFARLLLLALGLFLAYLGQNALEGAGLVPGLSLYGLALLALAGAVRYARGDRSRPVTDDAGPFPRQRLLYPVALLLALWAQNQSNVTLFGGHPLAAFLSWFLAIGVGAYALVTPRTEGGKRDDSMPGPESADASHSLHEIAGAASWLARPALLAVLLFIVALFPRLIAVTDHPAMLNGIEASLGLEALSVLRGEIRNPFAVSWLTNPTLPLFPMTAPLALLGRSVLGLRLVSIIAGTLTVPALYLIGRRLWGEVVALSAALLLAGYHFHIHYSRLGTTNAWDPLLALLALGTVGIAFHRSTRQSWLLAGLMTGLTAYFFTPSRLMPFFLLALLVYLLLLKPAFFRKQGRHALAGLALALVVALPQLVFFNANPGLYMERANTLG
ncbi:MAG: methyltransferase domain-containing protein, partial [Chloroflexota bacterium]